MKRQQAGFTLIELIMVIVILGVLSAFAIPKFADLSGDAERAATEGARAAIKSASGITHAACLVNTGCDANAGTATITLEGEVIDLVYGYPAGTSAGICDAASIDSNDFTCPDSGGVVTVTNAGGSCQFTYTQASSSGGLISAPTIGALTGCP